jgi:hypothetical protein
MKIAIIGAGWVGCHLARILKNEHDVVVFEKNSTIFSETSYKNQNRLHYGYHYARNSKTRYLCKDTFYKFINDYGDFVNDVDKNLYCVADKFSLIDLQTYIKIFDDYPIEETIHNFTNTEGCILTNEKHIDFEKVKEFFENDLKNLIKHETIDFEKLNNLSKTFDLVIDSTNNFIKLIDDDNFYELTLTLIYDKINPTDYDSVTFVDGELFSIYPYRDGKFTLTDVNLTPLERFLTIEELIEYQTKIDNFFILDKVSQFEDKVKMFIPNFKKHFKYDSFFLSIKSKVNDESGNRYPVTQINGNIISCFTGKIQGIYPIEEYVLKIIENAKNTSLL